MALTYAQVTAVTSQLFNDSVADNIHNSNPLFAYLLDKGKVVEDGGIHIQLPLDYATIGAVGTFNGYSLLDTTPTDNITAAKWTWKNYYAQMIIADTELWQNSGKSAAVNLVKAKMKSTMQSLKQSMGTDIFSTNGDSDLGFNGLRQTVKASGQAGNINTTDMSTWASDIDSSTTTLSLAAMEQQFLDASIGMDEPDIIVTEKTEFKKYWSLLQAAQRFSASEVGAGGFRYLLFNSTPVFHDSHCPDGWMFMLNSRWLYMYVNSNANFKHEKIGKSPAQAVYVDRVVHSGNLATDNRRMHSAFSALND